MRHHRVQNSTNYGSAVERIARLRAQRTIVVGYLVAALGFSIESVWDLAQGHQWGWPGVVNIFIEVVNPLTWLAVAYAYSWLAQLVIDHPDVANFRKVIAGLVAQTFLMGLVSVAYYSFLNQPWSVNFQSQPRWISVAEILTALGNVVAFVGFFLLVRATPQSDVAPMFKN